VVYVLHVERLEVLVWQDLAPDGGGAAEHGHLQGYAAVVLAGQALGLDHVAAGGAAQRWVVEAAHGWFNRFRKLLVRFEKLERSYLALCHLAAAIIVFRKIGLPENIIYG
jgi:hypothetical protein